MRSFQKVFSKICIFLGYCANNLGDWKFPYKETKSINKLPYVAI